MKQPGPHQRMRATFKADRGWRVACPRCAWHATSTHLAWLMGQASTHTCAPLLLSPTPPDVELAPAGDGLSVLWPEVDGDVQFTCIHTSTATCRQDAP